MSHKELDAGKGALYIRVTNLKMRILVANFDAQSIVSKTQVVEAVLRLPLSHIQGIQAIRYDPHRTIATTLSYLTESTAPVSSHGLYYHDRETAVIVLFEFNSISGFYHVLYHEIGHYVFLRHLDQEHRDEWMYRIRPQEEVSVTDYAGKNSREDFAECYALWCTRSGMLEGAPLRKAFFEEVVFGTTGPLS